MQRIGSTLTLVVVLAAAPVATANSGDAAKDTVKESAKTGGHAARDGAQTFGRSTRDFFTHGPDAAKHTWKSNAARTKEDAKEGGRRTRAAAHED